ncbi:MAG: LysM peptidoglycan-binding domain-containing protein [Pelagibacteraceae bacterium]
MAERKRGSMNAAIKSIKGTPGEERAVRAGVKAAEEALKDGKTQAQAKKVGAEITEKRLGENRDRAGKELLNLAIMAAPGGLLGLTGRTVAKQAIKKAVVKRKQSDAAAKTNKMRADKKAAAEPSRGKKTLEMYEKGKADKKAAPAREAAKKEKRRAAIAAGTGMGIGAGMYAGMSSLNKTSSQTVKSGDTLSGMARKAGVSLKELMAANPSIKNANMIRVGQKIKIPAKSDKKPYEGMSRSEMRAISMDREDQGDTPFRKGGMVKKKNYGAMDYRKGGMVLNVTDNRRRSRG